MTNLNPHGHKKEIAREVRRGITPFEQQSINQLLTKSEDVIKIYESDDKQWNLFQVKEGYFLSIPKNEKDGCKACIFGSAQHTEKYHELINL